MIGIYALTAFANAALLFLLEPMFSKQVLPILGGTPAVWNTCLVFFQAALLLGYLYAHLSTRWLGVRRQIVVHLLVIGASLATLPISVARMSSPAGEWPVLWLLALLTLSIGVPYTVLATGAPLLQRWLAHGSSYNPYPLYAASNLGSLLALLAYPFVVEPAFSLAEQRAHFSGAYVLNAALIAGCALYAFRRSPVRETLEQAPAAAVAPVTNAQRAWWLVLSAVPSSLLVGVTSFLTTDVASVPLLWVMPLALYLLTFVFAFSDTRLASNRWALLVQPFPLVVFLLWWYLQAPIPLALALPVHLLLFFVSALLCHIELVRRRPSESQLTEFYLWLSVGGLVGGAVTALLAPLVLESAIEYPLALVAAVALRGRAPTEERSASPLMRRLSVLVPVAFLLLFVVLDQVRRSNPARDNLAIASVAGVCAVLGVFAFRRTPVRFALALCVAVIVTAASRAGGLMTSSTLYTTRSFFGVHRVYRTDAPTGDFHILKHGTTVHGAQWTDPAHRREPLTYYNRLGPLGDILQAWSLGNGESPSAVGVIGLGAGSIACHVGSSAPLRYFEIDPAVVRIARTPRLFSFLADCAPAAQTIVGDARLTLAREPRGAFGLLVVDAFSSDAIPMHLLTREAMALYVSRLTPRGILALHISNRHLDVETVVEALARDAGLVSRVRVDVPSHTESWRGTTHSSSVWVAIVRREGDLGALAHDARWRALRRDVEGRLWTDDYSDLVGVLRW